METKQVCHNYFILQLANDNTQHRSWYIGYADCAPTFPEIYHLSFGNNFRGLLKPVLTDIFRINFF